MRRVRLAVSVVAMLALVFFIPIGADAKGGSRAKSKFKGGTDKAAGGYCWVYCYNGTTAEGEVDSPESCLYACEVICGPPCTLTIID